MPKIQPAAWYSGQQAQKLLGIKSRQYLTKYINEYKLLAIRTGGGGESTGVRYTILGSWLIDFQERYRKGLVRGKQYSKEEAKKLLQQAINDLEEIS